ncbi:unnamed protein product [Brachionus calyciflorus]|uniref:Transmembrane protein 198 n=1 Tax=Brachionus calyciflorus TaxID=104777 RepID=A0A813MTE3_9BILA|nr:unnamed protein product [Brachionus calyciflorus]
MSRTSSTGFNRLNLTTNASTLNNDLQTDTIFEQCNYNLLFSHLPLSIAFLTELDFNNFNLQTFNFPKNSHIQSQDLQYQQQLTYKLFISIATLLFGLFFATIGYRFLKLSTFICGFTLSSSIIYLILIEQKQLTLIENLIISLSIGVLFAFVVLLVQYIGLFLLGITGSVVVTTCILIVIDLFYGNKSAWLCILLLFLCATVQASLTLKFQRSFTILNTSSIGSALMLVALDFFVENNLLLDYILELYKVNGNAFNMFERQKALLKPGQEFLKLSNRQLSTSTMTSTTVKTNNTDLTVNTNGALGLVLKLYSSAHARLCWYTWLIFGSFFLMLIVSLLVQFLITAKNFDHRDSWQKLIRGSRKKRSANLEKIRLKSHIDESTHHHNQHTINNNFNTASRDSEVGSGSNNDTLLLVESGRCSKDNLDNHANLSYTVCSSTASPRPVHKKRSKTQDLDNIEIISFEILKSPKISSKKSKQNLKSSSKKHSAAISTSTTSSTSSATSSSSTCQLIPLKLNNDSNSQNTGTSIVSNSPKPVPSAPPLVSSQPTTLQPPPVPNQPPPKLPASLASQTSLPQLIQNKINHHRNSSSREREKDKERGSSSSGDKFRHFYQIRRNNGDVLSQDFINNLQNKLSSSSNLNDGNLGTSSSLNSNNSKSKMKNSTPSKNN